MDTTKRGRGRPSKLPAGTRHNIRCVVTAGELEKLREALETTGLSQLEFTRAAVLAATTQVNAGKKLPEFLRAVIDR